MVTIEGIMWVIFYFIIMAIGATVVVLGVESLILGIWDFITERIEKEDN